MEATNSLSTKLMLPHSKNRFMLRKLTVNAKQGENERELTENNMVVLRMRIKKMKAMDAISSSDKGTSASSDWNNWEKKLFSHYHEDVCEAIEVLQSYMMNTRPSVALGMVALMAMCVPVSTSTVVFNALKVAKGLLAGCHVCIDIDF